MESDSRHSALSYKHAGKIEAHLNLSGQWVDADGPLRRNRQNRVHEQILRSFAAHFGEMIEHKLHEPLGL